MPEPFDSDRKMMSSIYEVNNSNLLYTKGSFEAVIKKSTKTLNNGKVVKLTKQEVEKYRIIESSMSNDSLKVLAFAYKEIDKGIKEKSDYFDEEENLIFVGLIGLKDPVRKNIKDSINTCLSANIRPIMLTGDNLFTAFSTKALSLG